MKNKRENLSENGAVKIKYKSNCMDKVLFEVMGDLAEEFNNKYINDVPFLNIVHVKSINYNDVYLKLKKNGLSDDVINGLMEYGNNNIKPDGGAIILQYVDMDNKLYDWKLLLVSEMKYQGTNDERIKEGLKKQALGNAIERSGKNTNFIRLLCLQEKIYPFVVFCGGCDFREKFIKSKLVALGMGSVPNQYNLYKLDDNLERATYLINEEAEWDAESMREKLKQMLKDSLFYYLSQLR